MKKLALKTYNVKRVNRPHVIMCSGGLVATTLVIAIVAGSLLAAARIASSS